MIPVRPIKLTEADKVRFWVKVDRRGPNECWEWQACRDRNEYGYFRLNNSTYRAHRIAFVVTNGDTKFRVLHDCNHPWCCNPNHLYAGTQDDNVKQAIREGRLDNRGECNGHAKLTKSDVQEIRRLYVGGWLQQEIAEDYGISKSQVSHICNRKNWKHI